MLVLAGVAFTNATLHLFKIAQFFLLFHQTDVKIMYSTHMLLTKSSNIQAAISIAQSENWLLQWQYSIEDQRTFMGLQ